MFEIPCVSYVLSSFFLIFDLFSSLYCFLIFLLAEKCSSFQKSHCFTMFFLLFFLLTLMHSYVVFRSPYVYLSEYYSLQKKVLPLLYGSAPLWPEMSNFLQKRCHLFFFFSIVSIIIWFGIFWVTNDKNQT